MQEQVQTQGHQLQGEKQPRLPFPHDLEGFLSDGEMMNGFSGASDTVE
jgi:hypothetical protein